ncbi:MAG: type II secretion system protein [bacterium]
MKKGFTPTPKKHRLSEFFGVSSQGERGFTLIEMMTAMSVFLIIITISMGSILNIFDINRKSRSLKTVMSNLNLAVGTISREIRFGKNYHCESDAFASPPFTSPSNCPNGGNLISFLSNDGLQIVYRINGSAIESSTDGGSSYTALTAPEIIIENLNFYVLGAIVAPTNTLQPKVTIIIKGKAGSNDKSLSSFTLQTMISQRYLDN